MRGITRSPANLTRSLCDEDDDDDEDVADYEDDDDDDLYIKGAVCLSEGRPGPSDDDDGA